NALMDVKLLKPVATGSDLLVKIEAVSVNPVDCKIRKTVNPINNEHKILGWDAVGVVESIGDQVSMFKEGDKVWYAGAINRQGANSQYHLVNEKIVSLAPKTIDSVTAAALPLTSITAWELLFDRFNIEADEQGCLLIIGASGGVGSVMVQLAKQLTNLTIIGTASRPETQDWVKSLGADHVIDHSKDLISQLSELGYDSVNYLASLTHTAAHMEAIIEMIAPQGKFGLIDDADVLDIMPFKRKCVSVHWEFMFTRSLFATGDMIEQHKLLAEVAKLIDSGLLKSTVANNFGTINAENLLKAHALLESGKSKGKIVLSGF
ncbi:MAG: zinc-binding alcohol dehydrogenase family protein, partial [Psychromonas sp.]